jgi:hypothetical protein
MSILLFVFFFVGYCLLFKHSESAIDDLLPGGLTAFPDLLTNDDPLDIGWLFAESDIAAALAQRNQQDIDDLLSITAPTPVVELHSLKASQLRALGRLYQRPGAARWTKQQAIAALVEVAA